MQFTQFGSFDELMRTLQERSDDFESVEISVPANGKVGLGDGTVLGPAAAVIRQVGGKQTVLNLETTERLLNDGILARMRIPVKLREL